mgnify:CR=1 FL=1
MKKNVFNIIILICLTSTGCTKTIVREPEPGLSGNIYHQEAMRLHHIYSTQQNKPIKVKK